LQFNRGPEQQQPVGDSREHFDPLPAEGAPAAGGPLGQGDRAERHTEAEGVGRHVRGVGEQRQRARQPGADQLDTEDTAGQREDNAQPAAVRRCRGAVRTVVVPHRRPPGDRPAS
jgi:hypothetical protein